MSLKSLSSCEMNMPDPDGLIVIALGGNQSGPLGDPIAILSAARDSLAGEGLPVIMQSGWWRSAAWPDPSDPEYINGIVIVDTTLSPEDVLAKLHQIEDRFGRLRSAVNAPRTLDLDLIAHGRTVLTGPRLTLPHPRAADRQFVMGPLAELVPHWRHPIVGKTAAELAATATVGLDSSPLT
jgi:2-amino-4-hydroxy-6-hydroxymethyldihydropteridine diphosphokinase